MKRFLPLLLGFSCISLLACDDATDGTGGAGTASTTASGSTSVTGSTTGNGSTSTGSASSTSSGMTVDLSECQTSDDCPGGVCVDVNNGFKMCATPVEEVTMCSTPKDPSDECCSNADCVMPGAKCVRTPVVAVCSGVPPLEHNTCAVDQCAINSDCQGGICAPPGTVGNKVRTCVAAQCTGTSCAGSGLPCALVREPCCNTPAGFYCIDTCKQNSDCMDGYCEVNQQTMTPECKAGSPPCPA